MPKVRKNLRFDEALWSRAAEAAQTRRQSTTGYIEYSTEEQLTRDKRKRKRADNANANR